MINDCISLLLIEQVLNDGVHPNGCEVIRIGRVRGFLHDSLVSSFLLLIESAAAGLLVLLVPDLLINITC